MRWSRVWHTRARTDAYKLIIRSEGVRGGWKLPWNSQLLRAIDTQNVHQVLPSSAYRCVVRDSRANFYGVVRPRKRPHPHERQHGHLKLPSTHDIMVAYRGTGCRQGPRSTKEAKPTRHSVVMTMTVLRYRIAQRNL